MIDTKQTKIKEKKGRITMKMRKTLSAIPDSPDLSTAMRKAGYKEMTINTPKNLTESLGWNELLEKNLPDSLITEALQDDIESKPGRRVEELKLAAKLKGKLKEGNNILIIQSEPITEVIMEIPKGREGEIKI